MKRLMIYASLIMGLFGLGLHNLSSQAQSCPRLSNPQSTAYGLREPGKRCEGIQANDVSGDFSLISFTVGDVQLANLLKLQVPDRANGQQPRVRVRSKEKNYQLDPLEFQYSSGLFQVQWPNAVVRAENIPLSSLRATASVRSGSQLIYVPVIFSQGTKQYKIVLSSEQRAKIPVFEILQIARNGDKQVVYRSSRDSFQPKGQITFTWNGRDRSGISPAGRYELRVKAELEQDNAPPQPAAVSVAFEHDPRWLN